MRLSRLTAAVSRGEEKDGMPDVTVLGVTLFAQTTDFLRGLTMPMFKQADGTYVIKPREPGYEAVATTGAVPIDLTANGNSLGLEAPLEFGFGGSLSIAIYAGLMRYLELVPAIRAEQVTQQQACKEAAEAAWNETKNKAIYCLAIAVIIGVLPGTAGFLTIAGFIGFGFCAVRLTKQFYAALSEEQIEALKNAAIKADVKLAQQM